MEYNAKLTKKPIDGKIKPIGGARKVVDLSGKLLCFYKGKKLYDLNGEKIAPCVRVKRSSREEIAKVAGYCHDGKMVYFYGEETGKFLKKDPLLKVLIYFAVLAAVSLIAMSLVICVPIRGRNREVVITDKDGQWVADADIDIFGGVVLKPGTSGKYLFTVNNPNSFGMTATVELTFEYGGAEGELPLEYELLVNGIKTELTRTEKGYSALNINLKAKERNPFMLDWKWKFEAGRDGEDTEAGIRGEKYCCRIKITAEEA